MVRDRKETPAPLWREARWSQKERGSRANSGGDKGGEKEGDTGDEKGGARSQDESWHPFTTQEG